MVNKHHCFDVRMFDEEVAGVEIQKGQLLLTTTHICGIRGVGVEQTTYIEVSPTSKTISAFFLYLILGNMGHSIEHSIKLLELILKVPLRELTKVGPQGPIKSYNILKSSQ